MIIVHIFIVSGRTRKKADFRITWLNFMSEMPTLLADCIGRLVNYKYTLCAADYLTRYDWHSCSHSVASIGSDTRA